MKLNQMFPVRLLGFGLYWAWLFLVTVSPSPAFGAVECFGLPFELSELAMRLAFVCLFFFLWKKLETSKGRNMLIAACVIGGPLSTVAIVLVNGTALIAPVAFLMAFADASIFILWLCFFGHMRVGETALYMSLSYCIGGIVCLLVQMAPSQTCTAIAAVLPVASAMMFHLSNKYYSAEAEKPELFEATDLETSLADDGENYRYLLRLAIALGLCAFSFGTTSSSLFYGSVESLLPGPLVESACCIVLAAICGIIMFVTKQQQDLYLLYKFVPIVLVAGLMLLETSNAVVTTAGTSLVNLGYLMFEITALNDFCTAAKSLNRSLVRTFSSARIAITIGLLAGWVITACVHGSGSTALRLPCAAPYQFWASSPLQPSCSPQKRFTKHEMSHPIKSSSNTQKTSPKALKSCSGRVSGYSLSVISFHLERRKLQSNCCVTAQSVTSRSSCSSRREL